jgi:hypothetical protein
MLSGRKLHTSSILAVVVRKVKEEGKRSMSDQMLL